MLKCVTAHLSHNLQLFKREREEVGTERHDREQRLFKPKQEKNILPLPGLWWSTFFMRGKPNVLHTNTDTADTGQVPNASQLDPAQTQANREGG